MKLQLINPPLSDLYHGISRSGAYQPLNLIALATYVKCHLPDIDIEILDGDALSQNEILSKIDADIVGISPKILTYDNFLAIADVAKRKGAYVIAGGAHATALFAEILVNRPDIDAVVRNDGEISLLKLLQGINKNNIPNLAYRENGQIKINKIVAPELDLLPIPDNTLIDLKPYFRGFETIFSQTGYKKGMAIYSHKGCLWQLKSGGCVFCRNIEKRMRVKDPSLVWDEIVQLKEKFDIDFVWDVSDALTGDKKWLRKFSGAKPKNIDIGFLVYGRAEQIDDEVGELLAEVNCHEILVGVESGDDTVLKNTNKGITVDQVLRAAQILKKNSIKFYPSFVLGLPNETKKTADNTYKLAVKLVEMDNVVQLACSTLIPLPKSKSFVRMLNHPKLSYKYKNIDHLPVEEMRKDWVEHFTNVKYDYLEKILEDILNLTEIKSSFGKPKLK
jgi:radical SAM superfamily enzyme YgiQ (UPF0313 family)